MVPVMVEAGVIVASVRSVRSGRSVKSTSPRPSPQSGEGEVSDARQRVSMGLRTAWVSHQRAVRERWKVRRRFRRLTAAATGFGFGGVFIIGREIDKVRGQSVLV